MSAPHIRRRVPISHPIPNSQLLLPSQVRLSFALSILGVKMAPSSTTGRSSTNDYELQSTNTYWLIIIFQIDNASKAQLSLDTDQNLRVQARMALNHYGKEMVRCTWFRGEEELDLETAFSDVYTSNQLAMHIHRLTVRSSV